MDHLEHLSECEVCENADTQSDLVSFVDFEADMMEVRMQDVGIYDNQLMLLWENEMKVRHMVNMVEDENRKYYGIKPRHKDHGIPGIDSGIDLPLPPRPDEHEEE